VPKLYDGSYWCLYQKTFSQSDVALQVKAKSLKTLINENKAEA
jgi:hypothetical protein